MWSVCFHQFPDWMIVSHLIGGKTTEGRRSKEKSSLVFRTAWVSVCVYFVSNIFTFPIHRLLWAGTSSTPGGAPVK